jgi:hypothetical protein
MERITILLCAAVAVGEVAVFVPVIAYEIFEGPAASVDAGEPEVIETTGEVVS